MDRRDFLKISGAGALSLGAAACAPKNNAPAGDGREEMVLRTNPRNGDKVSLLGYGCMRWPMIKDENGQDVIDQAAVNEMVDYAMAHGINYYDTSPAYLQGQSERAAGIALSRYPRASYYIATKLSNFGDNSREASLQMYEDSFKDLQTDYFDYYLFHSIGRGGVEAFNKRYVENGMLEFLRGEKEKGRIRNLGFSFHGHQDAFDEFMKLYDSGEIVWDFCQIEMNYVDWKYADGKRNVNADYLYAELDKREIPIIVMEPLLGGRLANVPANIADNFKQREPDKSAASWAFRFVGSYPRILCILSGMASMDPLVENVQTFSHFHPMDEDEIEFMLSQAALMKEYPMVNCTDCKYC
ncbi:MAG: aldo/keto reductase, partial [Bacteroidales bacterium]|nr:aldo/keto reductase [Bacteroidales bacterium]